MRARARSLSHLSLSHTQVNEKLDKQDGKLDRHDEKLDRILKQDAKLDQILGIVAQSEMPRTHALSHAAIPPEVPEV